MYKFQNQEGNNAVFPVVLIIHANVSMGGTPIKNINDEIAAFLDNLSKYSLTHNKVELSVISVTDKTKCILGWKKISETPIKLPTVLADGTEDLNSAFDIALGLINNKCIECDSAGINYHTPAIVLISDDVTFSNDTVQATVKSKVENNELNLFLLLVNDDVAPDICAGKNAYTVNSENPYLFSGFFKLIENAVKSTVPYSANEKIDYSDLLDEIWEDLHIKKIF